MTVLQIFTQEDVALVGGCASFRHCQERHQIQAPTSPSFDVKSKFRHAKPGSGALARESSSVLDRPRRLPATVDFRRATQTERHNTGICKLLQFATVTILLPPRRLARECRQVRPLRARAARVAIVARRYPQQCLSVEILLLVVGGFLPGQVLLRVILDLASRSGIFKASKT